MKKLLFCIFVVTFFKGVAQDLKIRERSEDILIKFKQKLVTNTSKENYKEDVYNVRVILRKVVSCSNNGELGDNCVICNESYYEIKKVSAKRFLFSKRYVSEVNVVNLLIENNFCNISFE